MRVGELLFRLSECGVTLVCSKTEDRLTVRPASVRTPELIADNKQHKMEIIQIMREDEEMRRSGVIQSQRQVLDFAKDFFGEE